MHHVGYEQRELDTYPRRWDLGLDRVYCRERGTEILILLEQGAWREAGHRPAHLPPCRRGPCTIMDGELPGPQAV